MKEIICGIYKILSPSEKVYIGQAERIYNRWNTYFQMNTKTKNQPKLWRSFQKHGVNNHIFTILEKCNIEDLNCRERYWQDHYDVLNRGLNCILQECGEQRRIVSEESKEKRKLNYKPQKPSDVEIEKTRLRMIGNTYNTGRRRLQSEKESISKTMKSNGTQAKENNSMWGKFGINNPNSKLILDLETGIFYYGVKEASYFKNIPYSSLKKMMCGERMNKTSLIYA